MVKGFSLPIPSRLSRPISQVAKWLSNTPTKLSSSRALPWHFKIKSASRQSSATISAVISDLAGGNFGESSFGLFMVILQQRVLLFFNRILINCEVILLQLMLRAFGKSKYFY